MRSTTTLLTTLLTLALALPASAEHCVTYSTSQPEFTTNPTSVDEVPTFYVDNDVCHMSGTCLWSIWIYQESNRIPGLQRGDEVMDDTCHDMISPDTIVF